MGGEKTLASQQQCCSNRQAVFSLCNGSVYFPLRGRLNVKRAAIKRAINEHFDDLLSCSRTGYMVARGKTCFDILDAAVASCSVVSNFFASSNFSSGLTLLSLCETTAMHWFESISFLSGPKNESSSCS